MTRREWLINVARVALLRWRVVRGRTLPALATAVLVKLDAWAKQLEQRRLQ
jgi:hypothetical protein